MKSLLISALLVSLTLAASRTTVKPKANKFIVKLKSHASPQNVAKFLDDYKQRPTESANEQNKIHHTYSKKIFNGFSGEFSAGFLAELKKKYGSDIEYINKVTPMHAFAPIERIVKQNNPPSWGLTRVSQRTLDLNAPFAFPDSAGAGVDAWIVDTGCDPSRPDFEGRAKMEKSFIDGEDAVDGNGHGTHVSGTIGSKTYGIAKKVNIHCVKVLSSQGEGDDAGVIAGINYVAQNVRPGKTVMNMSLGGPKSQALDDAMAAAIKAGVVAIVAAGNDSQDACQVSPAGAPGIMAVGATDNTDTIADFSNVGSCVSILAPGVDITSLWIGGQDTNTISGTSMASPHVVGVAALLMAENNFGSPSEVYDALKNAATKDAIQNLDDATVNKLVFDNVSSNDS